MCCFFSLRSVLFFCLNRKVVPWSLFFFDDVLQAYLMGVSKNSGTPKSSILIFFNRVFHYFHHPFWGPTPIFGDTLMDPSDIGITTKIQPASASPPQGTRACLPPKCSRPERSQGYRFFGAHGCHPCVKNGPRNS